MLNLQPKPPTTTASAFYPLSVTGLLLLFFFTAALGLAQFTLYVWSSDMAGLASAMCVIFPILAAAYVCRYLMVAAESVAEGYDIVPGPPSPGEVEHLFGAMMKFMVAGLFAFLPLIVASALGAASGPVPVILVILGSVYIPMALLGMAVTNDMGACFPGTVITAIITVPARYLRYSILAIGAGVLFMVGWTDLAPKLPIPLKVLLDAGGGFLLIILIHRLGVLYREEFVLRSVIPIPSNDFSSEEICTPRRPVSDIERILEERRSKQRNITPAYQPDAATADPAEQQDQLPPQPLA